MLSRRRLLKKIKYRYKIKCGNITTNDHNLEYKLKSGFANLTTQTGVKKVQNFSNQYQGKQSMEAMQIRGWQITPRVPNPACCPFSQIKF